MEALAALALALLIIFFVGGLSLLAQWGRKNRGAEVSLIVILLFVSFLTVVQGALTVWSDVIFGSGSPSELSASSAIVILLAGFVGLALCIPPLRKVTGRRHASASQNDTAIPGSESYAAAVRTSGERFSRGWWTDPPIFFALWMVVVVLASNVIGLLAFALTPDEVSSALTSAGRITPATIVLSQLPFVVIAFCGVGLGVRRGFGESLDRLGYGPISLPHLGIVALFVVGALALQFVFDALFAALQPDLFEQVGKVSEGLFSPEGLSPVSAILFALLVGIGAGLGEETLFRGALQPALGILLTSVLFASVHVQYGPSILLVYLFVVSVGLGLLRKHINTTASFLAHAGYNALGVLLTYFFGV